MRVLIDGACPYCRALGRTLKALDLGAPSRWCPCKRPPAWTRRRFWRSFTSSRGTGPTGATPPSSPWPGGFPSSGPFTPFSSSSSPSGRASGSTASWRKGGPVPELPEVETTRRRLRPWSWARPLGRWSTATPPATGTRPWRRGGGSWRWTAGGSSSSSPEGGVELVAHLGMTGGSGWSRRPTPGRPWSSAAGPSTSTTPGASGASLGCGAGTTGRSPSSSASAPSPSRRPSPFPGSSEG